MTKIIECVPNVSEGRDQAVLEQIAETVRGVEGVVLLDVDPGAETHRTVFTFVGDPEAVAEAAFRFARTALRLIDMTQHRGAHARMGAVDVMPFVPAGGGATMDDCVALARRVGRRIGEELEIPVFLYERAATRPQRQSLAEVRRGEYEGLAARLATEEGRPDFGPAAFVPRSGATAVGARPFLIAYNVDLNTSDRKLAHDIALDIREQGRLRRDADGKIVRDAEGNKLRKPGIHRNVRAVGWYIPEFGRAQVSINLTDFNVTAPHEVFETIRKLARERGLRVTGSEIVGLVPLEAMLMAGRHYLGLQGRSAALPEPDLVAQAIASLGLDDVKPFDPAQAIIDYRLAPRQQGLRAMSLTDFADELSRPTPAPGGGSVAALAGALAASLVSMVASLTHASSRTSPEAREELEAWGVRAQALKDVLLKAIDDDTAAFEAIGAARRLPRKTDEQKAARAQAMVEATRRAIEVPLTVVEQAADAADLALKLASNGMEAAVSDAGVAAWCARAAAESAALNVRINLPGLPLEAERSALAERLEKALSRARDLAAQAARKAEERIASGS
ncbi:MAG: glutamate formimidoyltransferase [Acidobacteriota bacterium]|nr:glutamate formimidoyltransferase [Acidobacteriota bacterium]